MTKQPEAGKNYADVFGIPAPNQMVYNGGISWTGINKDGVSSTMESQKMTDGAMEYINRPSVHVGGMC